jgi:formylglycine-generating enzyme required for sulfatase activity
MSKFGPWTDFYALGATLYNLLTMNRPPEPLDIMEDGEEAFAFSASISKNLRNLVIWFMQPSRSNRPQKEEDIFKRLSGRINVASPASSGSEETICIGKEHSVSQSDDQGNLSISILGVTINMIKVDGGTFTMGATSEQGSDVNDDEKPAHSVTLSDYYIGQTEVTQALWKVVMWSNPSYFKGDKKPVENVSWEDCQKFISKLNKLTGKTFGLPTEAQWEFAARGGKSNRGSKYSGSGNINDVAWYGDNSGNGTHDVGTKSPNELSLYDMSGNVWEWCSDLYRDYSSNSHPNPTESDSSFNRVYRGGSWFNNDNRCRVSYRYFDSPDYRSRSIGLRLVLNDL